MTAVSMTSIALSISVLSAVGFSVKSMVKHHHTKGSK